ncbi:MAG: glycosyltransferase family 4 protein [Deltaproteobacteria bacterium]|nr:glycosyltransferase family 4 protein [Deltaproteobacteria bacterium]
MGTLLIVAERVEPKRGGLAVATSRIARHAVEAAMSVHIVYPSKEVAPGLSGRREREGIVHHPVGVSGRLDEDFMALHHHTLAIARAARADVIHGIYATRPGWVAATVGCELSIPSVVSLRGNDLDRGLWRSDELPFLRGALTTASAATGVSRALCQRASAIFGRPVEHITNAVDVERFRPEARDPSLVASLELQGLEVIGFLGELRAKKGMRFLLPAFDALRARRDVALLLMGGVRDDARDAFLAFQRMAPEASARVRVIDYVRDPDRLSRLMALCDLMVFPSLFDGTPNALLEAMAAGRPILATDAGGQADLVEHGVTGAVLPIDRLDVLPDAIDEMLDLDSAERAAMGTRARAFVTEHHGLEDERRAYQDLYARLARSAA